MIFKSLQIENTVTEIKTDFNGFINILNVATDSQDRLMEAS